MNAEWKNKLQQFGTVSIDLALTETVFINKDYPEGIVTPAFLAAEAEKEIARVNSERASLQAAPQRAAEIEQGLRDLITASDLGMERMQALAANSPEFWQLVVDGLTEFREAVQKAKELVS